MRSLSDELFGMTPNAIKRCLRSLSDGVTLQVIELLSACNEAA